MYNIEITLELMRYSLNVQRIGKLNAEGLGEEFCCLFRSFKYSQKKILKKIMYSFNFSILICCIGNLWGVANAIMRMMRRKKNDFK